MLTFHGVISITLLAIRSSSPRGTYVSIKTLQSAPLPLLGYGREPGFQILRARSEIMMRLCLEAVRYRRVDWTILLHWLKLSKGSPESRPAMWILS